MGPAYGCLLLQGTDRILHRLQDLPGGDHLGRLFLIEGVGPAALGILLGLAGAMASTGILRGLLFEVAPQNPVTLVIAALLLLLLAVATAATWNPTLRAARTDPVRTLARH